MEINEILTAVHGLASRAELKQVSDAIRIRWRDLNTIEAIEAKSQLRIGQRVKWAGKKSGITTGTIRRIKKVRAEVENDKDGLTWDIPLTMLKPLD